MSIHEPVQLPDWQTAGLSLYAKTEADVERALARSQRSIEDFMALVSPAARPYLEVMAQRSHQLTVQRFGRTQQLFAPLYVSNACANECDYCGFSMSNRVRRKVLNDSELAREADFLKRQGFEHLLLVAGEAPRVAGVEYFERALRQLGPTVAQISLEVQPMATEEYRRLHRAGLHAVLVYQETYHRPTYRSHHTRGNKADYDQRLAALGRAGDAGIHRLGLGVLLGLADWRLDSLMAAYHLRYLERRCWRSRFSMSFPRLRPAEGGFQAPHPLSDADLVQLICAWRLFSPELELSLSTREPASLREHLLPLGVTSLSAGSSTRPGGYAVEPEIALEQFSIDDNRSLKDVVAAVQRLDYQPVWKDWDPHLHVELW
ncbi:2-iminoacetate synthase ThiH [Saccharospirillum impatiens]|uniref:2-iminoacetate synthase ThiH n=1 Tax=Saccharospirillum impatiens TaxID=169438 RepID=UPI000423B72E|nr:2-iminoacetate synthase ThiH [Saccharospirillum impatiens]